MFVDLKNNEKTLNLPEFIEWKNNLVIDQITLKGTVVNGFKRGSKQLGVPTANIEMTEENLKIVKNMIPGVYSAFGMLSHIPDLKFK